jgi:hypothetical protein
LYRTGGGRYPLALHLTAAILDVKFLDDTHARYWMDSVKLQVSVE